jgi:hypothetical protein
MADGLLSIRQIARDVPQGWESAVIAMNDAVDVLRHGWQDAAGIFAPDSPEIAELLQARLEMAVANRSLDENHLLGAIDDVESMAASTGSPSGQALARRLRRTVYEYLLALDAAPPPVLAAPTPTLAPAVERHEEAEPEEVTALGHRATPLDTTVVPSAPAAAKTEAVDVGPVDVPTDEHVEAAAPDPEPAPPVQPAPATPVTSPEAAAPPAVTEVGSNGHPDGFVAPRAGFHVIEDTHPTHAPSEATESPLQMPDFAQPDAAAAPPAGAAHAEGDLATYQWTRPLPQSPPQAPAAPDGHAAPPAAQPAPESDHPAAAFEVDPENGWHVRRGEAQAPPTMDEDPFENNPRLADLRRRIDERLRRKKCDEAAALLQELAQETGGRVVAELAMNAGDRCQSLGKSNAALNCYLAGSRADPVYELPLSRLADICIDDQDTELAVSYLERIARLYRFRGDDKAALRVYRRIATIAPYREDVLTLLLNVQNTGRFES